MRILAIIPARMGSTRIPRKNLCEISPGLSLVQHAVDCARHCGLVDDVVVSTDDLTIPIQGARLIRRPDELCGPASDIADAVAHAVRQPGNRCDYTVTLQPAVVARSLVIVRRMIEHAIETGCSVIPWAVTHPFVWTVDRDRQGHITWPAERYRRSQDSHRHGIEINSCTVAPEYLALKEKPLRWYRESLSLMPLPAWATALDIDTPADLAQARDLWPWAAPRLETWDAVPFTLTHLHDQSAKASA